jgi:hypothetical protein
VFQIIQNEDILDIMIGKSHHSKFSVIIIAQYLFPQGRYAREIVSQCAYTFLFKNCRDLAGVERFAYKIAPRNTNYFLAAFEDATEIPYNCLLIDCKPETPSYFKLRTYFLNEIQSCYPEI